ncbi:hypothetical protein WBG83_07375 [Paenibacillus sp. y28]
MFLVVMMVLVLAFAAASAFAFWLRLWLRFTFALFPAGMMTRMMVMPAAMLVSRMMSAMILAGFMAAFMFPGLSRFVVLRFAGLMLGKTAGPVHVTVTWKGDRPDVDRKLKHAHLSFFISLVSYESVGCSDVLYLYETSGVSVLDINLFVGESVFSLYLPPLLIKP